MIATLLVAAALESAPVCGSGAAARAALAEKAAIATPGLTFAEVTARLGPPMVKEEFWGPGPPRQLEWLLGGSDGNRTALQVYLCDFDEEDRLTGCAPAPWGEMSEFQKVSESAWKRVQKGWRISTVYRLLCRPPIEDVGILGTHDIQARYAVAVPGWKYEICHGTLSFERGRVAKKEMYCR